MKGWKKLESGLYKSLVFRDFATAFSFMTEVAKLAEIQQHHPNWSNVYNEVHITLNTHDSGGGITGKDIRLANAIDELIQEYWSRQLVGH